MSVQVFSFQFSARWASIGKRWLLALVAVLIFFPAQSEASDVFQSTSLTKKGWEVKFQNEGIRWKIEIDGDAKGISKYGQQLSLTPKQKLVLTEKHTRLEIELGKKNKKDGLNIKKRFRNPETRKIELSITFEEFQPTKN